MDFLTSGPGVRQGWSQKGCAHHPGYSTTEGFLIVWFWGSVEPSLYVVEQAGAQFFCLSPPLERADAADSLSMGPGGTVSSTVHSFELCFLEPIKWPGREENISAWLLILYQVQERVAEVFSK